MVGKLDHARRSQRVPTNPKTSFPALEDCGLPAPAGLDAYTFSVGEDEYVLLTFPSPRLELPAGLSPAEREVAEAVLSGCSNAEIARGRGTSVRTVANQLQAIYKKLGVSGRTELIRSCLGVSPELDATTPADRDTP